MKELLLLLCNMDGLISLSWAETVVEGLETESDSDTAVIANYYK